MNKTDWVFIGSIIVQSWNLEQAAIHPLISTTLSAWLGVTMGIIGLVTFLYYEKITGTFPPPQPPIT